MPWGSCRDGLPQPATLSPRHTEAWATGRTASLGVELLFDQLPDDGEKRSCRLQDFFALAGSWAERLKVSWPSNIHQAGSSLLPGYWAIFLRMSALGFGSTVLVITRSRQAKPVSQDPTHQARNRFCVCSKQRGAVCTAKNSRPPRCKRKKTKTRQPSTGQAPELNKSLLQELDQPVMRACLGIQRQKHDILLHNMYVCRCTHTCERACISAARASMRRGRCFQC